ncbi:MAG: DUF11 domain-containing protein, partial [Chloroflexi bacterium]|nr:DUF11 domain-containing protein [Chloroflexota bacterium]
MNKIQQSRIALVSIRLGLVLLLLVGLVGLAPPTPVLAAPGDLDPGFDSDGKQTADFFGLGDRANGVAVQSDGKIIVVGYAFSTMNGTDDFALARYNYNGSLDTTFGTSYSPYNGAINFDFYSSSTNDQANGIAIQPSSGEIVVAGYAFNSGDSTDDFAVLRFNSTGSLVGMMTHNFWNANARAHDVAIQSDGKIVVAGYTSYYGTDDFALTRYNSDGSLDNSFGPWGNATTIDGFMAQDQVNGIALYTDDRIVVAGYANNGSYDQFALARYDANGNLDGMFGSGGKQVTDFAPFGGNNARINGAVVQSDGSIVVVGYAHDGSSDKPIVARYDSSGNLDATFSGGDGSNGVWFPPSWGTPSPAARFNAVALQSDGKIVATGYGNDDFVVSRFDTSGSLDATFGTSGSAITDFFGADDQANALALHGDGKIVTAGYARQSGQEDFALVRYEGDVTDTTPPDTTLTSTPPDPDNDPTPTFEFTGDDGGGSGVASFECQVNSNGWVVCTNPYTTSSLLDGLHLFEVRAVDSVGLTDTTPSSYTWTIETVPPPVPVLLAPANGTLTDTQTITLTWQAVVAPDLAGYYVGLDGHVTDVGNVTQHVVGPLLNGAHTWTVASYDTLGNTSAYTANWSLTVDADVPVMQSIHPVSNTHSAPLTTTVSITYDQDMDATSVSSHTFAVHRMQTGLLTQTFGSGGGTITLTPTIPFHPGELIQASATGGLRNITGTAAMPPTVWQFRTGVEGGYSAFVAHPISPTFGGAYPSSDVSLGDLDGDGNLDAVVANDLDRPQEVYLNDGSGRFFAHPVTSTFGTGNSQALALGDLDSDGDLDVMIVNEYADGIQEVYLNDGTGGFALHNTFGTGYAQNVDLGDVDGDGDLDAVLALEYPVAPYDSNQVYLNDGAGHFTLYDAFNVGAGYSYDAALGDLDGDGDLDVFVPQYLPGKAQVYLNDGTGDFVLHDTLTTTNESKVALGDLDDDGDLDAVSESWVHLNDGAGNFAVHGALSPSFSTGVELGDLDGDGDLDVVVAKTNGDPQEIYLNDGTGNFGPYTTFAAGYNREMDLGDVDGDGDLDIVFANGNWGAQELWLNQLGVTAVDPVPNNHTVPLDANSTITISGPISQTSVTTRTVFVHGGFRGHFTATSTLDTSGSTIIFTPTAGYHPGELVRTSVTTGVWGSVGKPLESPYVWEFRAAALYGSGQFPTGNDFGPGDDWTESLALGDVDGDGDLDLAVGNDSQQNVLHLNTGSGTFDTVTHTFGTGNDNTQDAVLGDVDGDGDLDLISGNGNWSQGQQNVLYFNDGDGNPFDTITYTLGADGDQTYALALGDVDGDGDLDLAVGNWEQPNVIYFNDGSGNPFDTITRTFGTGSDSTMALALGDVDKDGDLDLAVGNSGTFGEQNYVYLNDGGAQGGTPGAFDTTSYPFDASDRRTYSLALGDVDDDGSLDLVVGNWNQQNYVYLNDGDGNPFDTTSYPFGTGNDYTYAPSLDDVDADGDLDLVVGNNGQNVIYLNDGDGNPFDTTLVNFGPVASTTYALAVGDVDADGDLDIVEGNYQGQNVVYLNVDRVDLSVAKSVDPPTAAPGDPVTYTIAFVNSGPLTATGVVISDSVPVSVTNPVFAGSSGAIITQIGSAPDFAWEVENLGVNTGGVITLTGTLAPNLPCGYTFANAAVITTTAVDTNPGNNTNDADLTVLPIYGVVVEPPTDTRSGDLGSDVVYTLQVTNTGNCLDAFTVGGMGRLMETTRVTPTYGSSSAWFGTSVAVSKDTAVVGAPQDNANGLAGAAYVYYRDQGGPDNWGLLKQLTASDGAASDWFGYSIAIDGDTIVVGARTDDASQGSAYVFYRDQGGADNWGEVVKLTASDGAASEQFGASAAIYSDTIVIGAYGDDDYRGAAYVFYRGQGGADNWGEVTKLTASDGVDHNSFGIVVSVYSDTVVVGANGEDSNGNNSGATYVYGQNVGGADNWGQVKKLLPSDIAAGDLFGISTAIYGDIIVAGSYGDDNNQGAAYVFYRDEGGTDNWGQKQKLAASDGASGDGLGWSAAIDEDTVIIGAGNSDGWVANSGAAYIYGRNEGGADNWGQKQKLFTSDSVFGDQFGRSASIDGDTVIMGAYGDNVYAPFSGSAYVFEQEGFGPLWHTTAPFTVGPLDASVGADVNITVTVPLTAQVGDWDIITPTFVSRNDFTARDSSVLTTTASDNTPPETPTNLLPAEGALINDPDVTLSWDAVGDAVSYTVSISGTIYVVEAPTTTLTLPLPDGPYTWTVTAYDAAGNPSTPTPEQHFTVDTIAPATPTNLQPAEGATVTETNVTLSWDAVGDAVSYTVSISGTIYVVDAPTSTLTLPLPDAPYTWTVTAYDAAGNPSDPAPEQHFTVDTIAPATPTNLTPAEGTVITDTNVTLSWDAVGDAVSYTVSISGTIYVVDAPTSTLTLPLPDGPYTWTVTAYDAAGNASDPAPEQHFTVDTQPTGSSIYLDGNGNLIVDLTAD